MDDYSRDQIFFTGPLAVCVSLWALFKLGLFKNIDMTKYFLTALVIFAGLALLYFGHSFVAYLIRRRVQSMKDDFNNWGKQLNFEFKAELKALRSEQIKREEKMIQAIRELNFRVQELSKSPEEVSNKAIEQFL